LKKPSEPKPTTQPRSRLVFFVDRSLGRRKLPDALRALHLRVEVHDDHFAAEEVDVNWLAVCGARRWVVVTKDFAIRGNPAEIAALDRAGVHAIFLRGRKQPVEYAIANFAAALPMDARTL
jgi:hypothetical protein